MFSKSKATTEKSTDTFSKAGAAPAPKPVNHEKPQKSVPPSIISESLIIHGDLTSSGDIQIDGEVQGDIRSHKVTVGQKAKVFGALIADHIKIAGSVEGEITGREVTLSTSARVTGDIYHDRLAIEAGAHMQGLCRRVENIDKRMEKALSSGLGSSAKPDVNGVAVSQAGLANTTASQTPAAQQPSGTGSQS